MSEFHVGLLSQNLPKLTKFYQDLFGQVPDEILTNEYLEFSLPHKLIVDIEALNLIKEDLGEVSDKFYFRLEVGDIDTLYQKCQQEEVNIIAKPVTKDYGKIEMFLRDPEDNLIQCFQKINFKNK